MMKPWLQLCQRGGRFCVHCLLSFLCWGLWLLLVALLVGQTYIAVDKQLPVPGFLLRSMEQQLAASGVSATLGRTTFDPKGQVLVENLHLSLPTFEEPVARVASLYVRLDPWALLAGRFEPVELRASGISLSVPAMLSDSGRNEVLMENADLTLVPHDDVLEISHLTTHLAGVAISARGTLDLSRFTSADETPAIELLARSYSEICRRLPALTRPLAGLRDGRIDLTLRPSEKFGAIARVMLTGQGYQPTGAATFTVGPFRASTRVPLRTTEPFFVRIAAATDRLQLPEGVTVDRPRTTLRARIAWDGIEFTPQRAEIEARSVAGAGVAVRDLASTVRFNGPAKVATTLVARVGSEAVAVAGTLDPEARSAALHAAGRFDPALLGLISRRVGRDIRPFLDFTAAPRFDVDVAFAPGAQFESVDGEVAAENVRAYGVTFGRIGGHIRVADGWFKADHAAATIGDNFATGTYEHELATHRYRFLLNGRLRPKALNPWFREWWDNFWTNFDFTAAAPDASVDVTGRWRDGPSTSVFVYANGAQPVINGVPLDHVTTLIFLRPNYYDAMEVHAYRDGGAAHGRFTRHHDPETRALARMDFDLTSSLAPAVAAGLVGREVEEVVRPFVFATPVQLEAAGFVGEAGREIALHGTTQGDFTFHDFPLTGLNFTATVEGDEVLVDSLSAGFAGGTASGRLRVMGPPDARRLGFDLGLKQGNLQQASVTLSDYLARRRGQPPPPPSAYMQRNTNVVLDLDVSAEGNLDDPLSFSGSGNAQLNGRGLGEIRLLGLLSELLNFTSLRFNRLLTTFKVERDHLEFPDLNLIGSNAAISAHGTYALEEGTLDFNARIYPFQESRFILKSVGGAVLSPLSNVLEVKLNGQLDKPKWAFVIGPTNILRSLGQAAEGESTTAPGAPPPPAAPPPPPPP
ncbi:MAG: AsmA-like C-terminal region-containing protein, partial [Cephaloticoccus sp.]